MWGYDVIVQIRNGKYIHGQSSNMYLKEMIILWSWYHDSKGQKVNINEKMWENAWLFMEMICVK